MGDGRELILFGLAEQAEVVAYYFEHDTDMTIAAVTADGAYVKEDSFLGYPVVPFEEIDNKFPPDRYLGFVAVGYSQINQLRESKCRSFRDRGYELASYISSKATLAADFRHGWNALVLEDNTIQPFVGIGNGVTLWSGNHIGHHCSIDDFAFVTSHVVLSGGVRVGSHCFIGVNATTNDHISIGARSVIGSGSVVPRDVPADSVLTTRPATVSRVPSSRLRRI